MKGYNRRGTPKCGCGCKRHHNEDSEHERKELKVLDSTDIYETTVKDGLYGKTKRTTTKSIIGGMMK